MFCSKQRMARAKCEVAIDIENSVTEKPKQPDEGFSKEAKKERWGARHTLALLGFLAFASLFSMRVNISVAIVAMVGSENVTRIGVNSAATDDLVCPIPVDDANGAVEPIDSKDGEFHWDETTQGQILGSYFYGYALSCLIGGVASERYGGKMVFGFGILFSGIATMLSPLAARTSDGLFIVVRMILGICGGVTFPAMHTLLSSWVVPERRAVFSIFMYSGYQLGTVVTIALSGVLCASDFLGGWPSVFYVFGGLAVVWAAFWFSLVADTPAEHPRISQQELKMLQPIALISGDNRPKGVPWRSVLTSAPVWGTCIHHMGSNWGAITLLFDLPTYLHQIQHFSLSSNGFLSALPYITTYLLTQVYIQAQIKIAKAGILSTVNVRRLSASIAGYGPMLSLIGMYFVGCDRSAAIFVLCCAVGMTGTSVASYPCSFLDLSPRYAGTLLGLSTTMAAVAGIFAPLVTGMLTNGSQTVDSWRTVFLISATIYGITTTIYNITITAEVQPWNYQESEKVDEKKWAKPEIQRNGSQPARY